MPWHSVIIDEAQNIKNHDTAQAKAIKTFKADNFIAMSGTPVENRLSELWSIVDYSNRGLLGSAKDFKEDYSTPIEVFNDVQVAENLKKVTAPFMMRRLKSDKSIISDLPDKIEMDVFSTLTAEQAGLYEKTLEKALMAIEAIDAKDSKELFHRQGLVLQMILALKQICNHPAQFLKNNITDPALSGKVDLLFSFLPSSGRWEICCGSLLKSGMAIDPCFITVVARSNSVKRWLIISRTTLQIKFSFFPLKLPAPDSTLQPPVMSFITTSGGILR